MHARGFRLVSMCGAVLLAAVAQSPAKTKAKSAETPAATWIETWGASQQIPEPQNALSGDDLRDATVRQIFHLSVGGATLRVHLTNAFGIQALHFTSVHIARPVSLSSAAIDVATDKALTFSGQSDVIVPPGAEMVSDPIQFPVEALGSVAVSYHLDNPPSRETSHPGSRATTYYVHGDQVSAADLPDARHVEHWYQVTAVDVIDNAPGAGTVVALGDSTTDGHAAPTNGNDRWTDAFAAHLESSPATRDIAVSNRGTGGNHLLTDGLGPNALARFNRDVLAPAGVKWLIVYEGVNDLGGLSLNGDSSPAAHAAMVANIEAAYAQMIVRAHAHGIRILGATITPYGGSDYYHPLPSDEADRQAVNAWIRAAGHFDGVIDFDAVVRDPQHSDRLLPAFDCGDHLHPSPVGYKAMGEAVPLSLFAH
ncbi:MAG: SGNH/GDSL hydrolase family protein [Terracidiphilus sp.]|jgi:lysophospholipase L1-like esterase